MSKACYRKRPVLVEAIQFTWRNVEEVVAWMEACSPPGKSRHGLEGFMIRTDSGEAMVESGDWIIRGIQGEFYPCKAEVFRLTYESAIEPNSELTAEHRETLQRCAHDLMKIAFARGD